MDLGNGGPAARVVENFLDDAANVAVLFGVIESAEFDGALAGADVGFEDGGLALALGLINSVVWVVMMMMMMTMMLLVLRRQISIHRSLQTEDRST